MYVASIGINGEYIQESLRIQNNVDSEQRLWNNYQMDREAQDERGNHPSYFMNFDNVTEDQDTYGVSLIDQHALWNQFWADQCFSHPYVRVAYRPSLGNHLVAKEKLCQESVESIPGYLKPLSTTFENKLRSAGDDLSSILE